MKVEYKDTRPKIGEIWFRKSNNNPIYPLQRVRICEYLDIDTVIVGVENSWTEESGKQCTNYTYYQFPTSTLVCRDPGSVAHTIEYIRLDPTWRDIPFMERGPIRRFLKWITVDLP